VGSVDIANVALTLMIQAFIAQIKKPSTNMRKERDSKIHQHRKRSKLLQGEEDEY